MMKSMEYTSVAQVLNLAAANGMKAFRVQDADYGYIITHNDNVLYVQSSNFDGLTISLQYKPSRENGRGCRCTERGFVYELTLEELLEAERQGISFAKSLKAPLYANSKEWMDNYWFKDRLVPYREVTL